MTAGRRLLLAVLVAAAMIGCSGQGERGRNKDLDRPKPAEKN
jgi:hypothetical protein